MKDIFITKGTVNYGAGLILATGGAWTIDTLTTGALAVLNQDGSVIDGTIPLAAEDLTGTFITLNLKTPNGINKQSVPLYRDGFSYKKTEYVAPVAPVKYLGNDGVNAYSLNLPSSLTVGSRVGVTIVDKSKPTEDTSRFHTYEFTSVTGDTLSGVTAANIIVKLVALINADPDAIVTAAVVDDSTNATGISFTGTAGVDFTIANVDGVLKDSDIVEYKLVNNTYDSGSTTAVAYNPGQGTSAQMLALEKEVRVAAEGYKGALEGGRTVYEEDNMTVSGATYVQYTLTSKAPKDDAYSDANKTIEVIIAVPSGDTGAGKHIAVLDEILALV